ncbi:hypothetical protein WA026_006443 [Henosepilachna vigintioctopunctata]|uniref:Uncharacterized protein n=1 Tax=Henosepilachna vigintioctopunctata TaxID=420089 RepID=A0AAW1TNX5_9CUCU
MSSKLSPRSKKHKYKEEKYETIVQVHKILKSDTSSEKDNQSNLSLSRTDNSEDGESNKAFQMEDYNENYNHIRNHTPSREISVDESRPQSLSFYEDEKIPEELSGNLELLSPEERKHYRRRKDYNQLDADERRAYNTIQDLYNTRDAEEITTTKKSKSRKKKHIDAELGIGNSREIMIPKKRKKRKHKRREEDHETKNEITIALEELQDDVFERPHEEFHKGKKVRETPDSSDRLYVQKKNKFEVTSRPSSRAMYKDPNCDDDCPQNSKSPLNIAISIQKCCMKLFLPCHGLLAGLTFGQWLYLICNGYQNIDFLEFYSNFNDPFITLFYFMITICLVSSLDRIDVAHIRGQHFLDFSISYRIIGVMVILLYIVGLILHLTVSNTENKLGLLTKQNMTVSNVNVSVSEIKHWNRISLWRFIFVVIPWILVAATASDSDNMLYVHLQSMLKYLPDKCFRQ